MVIWKYAIEATGSFTIDLPRGATPLSVQVQHLSPYLWVLLDPDAHYEPRRFMVKGTGHPADDVDPAGFIGTFQLHEGALVFHLFQEVPPAPEDE